MVNIPSNPSAHTENQSRIGSTNEHEEKFVAQLAEVARKMDVEVDFNNPSSVAEFLVPGEKANNPSYVSLYDVLQYLSSDTRKTIVQGMAIDVPYLIEKATVRMNNKQKFIAGLEAEDREYENPDGLKCISIPPDSHFADVIPTEFMGAKLIGPRYYEALGAYMVDCVQANEDEEENKNYWKAHSAIKDLFLADNASWDLDDCLAYISSGVVRRPE